MVAKGFYFGTIRKLLCWSWRFCSKFILLTLSTSKSLFVYLISISIKCDNE